MQEQSAKKTAPAFFGGLTQCLVSFIVLGNYFAFFGIRLAQRAKLAFYEGRRQEAQRLRGRALAWAYWGLLASTPINAAIIYGLLKLLFAAIKFAQENHVF